MVLLVPMAIAITVGSITGRLIGIEREYLHLNRQQQGKKMVERERMRSRMVSSWEENDCCWRMESQGIAVGDTMVHLILFLSQLIHDFRRRFLL